MNLSSPVIALCVLAWLVVINLAAWQAFALDKHASVRGKRRIPERTLLWLAALGGSPAAMAARRILRHKTRKEPFRTRLLAIAGAQLVAAALAIAWRVGWIG